MIPSVKLVTWLLNFASAKTEITCATKTHWKTEVQDFFILTPHIFSLVDKALQWKDYLFYNARDLRALAGLNGPAPPHPDPLPCLWAHLSPGFQSLPELFCKYTCPQACLLAGPWTYRAGSLLAAGVLQSYVTPCLQVLSLVSCPGWTLEPCCSLVSSPASGPVSFHPWLGSLDGPWAWLIACLAWGCWWTLLPAPGSDTAVRPCRTVPRPVRALPPRGHPWHQAHPPWSGSRPLLFPDVNQQSINVL